MVNAQEKTRRDTSCPSCDSNAIYKYGKIASGKQRYLCMICGRQFTLHHKRLQYNHRPFCPQCGTIMHIYKRENKVIRFRCSQYPNCKTFKKHEIRKEISIEMYHS